MKRYEHRQLEWVCECECNVGEKYVLPQAQAFGLSWFRATARNNPLLNTPEGPEGSTGWRAPVAPTEKQAPDADEELVLAHVLGVVKDRKICRCPRA